MDYIYVSSAIKAKTTEFLTEKHYQTLSQTPKAEFPKALCDLGYGYTSNNQSLERLLFQEEEKLIKQLKAWLGEEHNIIKCYQLLHDIINIKIIFKQLYFLDYSEERFDDLGYYSHAALEKAIKYHNYDLVSNDKELFQKLGILSENLTALELSNEITKVTYQYIYEKYILNADSFIKEYFQIKMTAINILTVYRSLRLNQDFELFKKTILDNSLIDKDALIELFNNNNKDSLNKLILSLPLYFEEIFTNLNSLNNINELSNNFEQLILKIMNKFDYETDSLGPVLSYIIKKRYEMKNIKILYFDKKNGLNNLLVIGGINNEKRN